MIFKRCTVGGCDYVHKSFSRTVDSMPKRKDEVLSLKDSQSGRAIIPVNPILSERLNSIDMQLLIEGGNTKMKLQEQVYCKI